MATSVLTISGTTIVRPTAKIILNRWDLNYDGPSELAFTELCANLPGSFAPEAAVTLTIGGVLSFAGNIYSRAPVGVASGPISICYRCLDLRFAASDIPITAADGTGVMAFNIPSSDIGNYQPNFAGKSVGGILTILFNQHSAQLSAIGITTDATTTSQLAALTVVPPDPVYLQGNRLWAQVDQLLQQWYGNRMVSFIMPGGQIRVIDTLSLTAQTLTFGTDPIRLDSMMEDTTECYTAVTLRGRSNVDGAYLSLGEGTLIDPNNASGTNLEASWSMSDFLTPKGASSTGIASSVTSTTITVQSDNALETWVTNYWSGIQAQITAIDPLSTLVTGMETHRVTANTALTAGGTSVITIDLPFGSTGFTRYALRGQPAGKSECYRRLNIKNTYIAQHLVSQFNFAMHWSPSQGAVTLVWVPVGVVDGVSGGVPFEWPLSFEVIPYDGTTNGYIRCYQPWVSYFNSQANLNAGGGSIVQATNIKVLLPFSRGTMTTSYPASGYAGTAYTRFGVQQTLTRDYSTWWDQGSTTAMNTLAQQIHATVSNVIQEGQLTYFGQNLTAFTPGSPVALSLANWTGTTGYETIGAPVRRVSMEWPQEGGSEWITRMSFSTRRQMYSGDRLYVHPAFAQTGFLSGRMAANMVTGISFMGAVDATGLLPFGMAYGGQGKLTEDAQSAMDAMKRVDPARYGGAAATGDVAMSDLRSQFINPDITVSPTFSAQERATARDMARREADTQQGMERSERDLNPRRVLMDIQGAERAAAKQVFSPAELPRMPGEEG